LATPTIQAKKHDQKKKMVATYRLLLEKVCDVNKGGGDENG
jgi:hypothetical protein